MRGPQRKTRKRGPTEAAHSAELENHIRSPQCIKEDYSIFFFVAVS